MSWPPEHSKAVVDGRIPGEAKPAGSKNAFVIRTTKSPNPYTGKPDGKKHPLVVHASDGGTTTKVAMQDSSGAKGKAWRADIQAAILPIVNQIADTPLDVPLVLEVNFVRPRNKGHLNAAGQVKDSAPAFPTVAPDATKLLRAFEDALNKILWEDDSRMVDIRVSKRFGASRFAEFKLWRMPATVGELRLAEHNTEQAELIPA